VRAGEVVGIEVAAVGNDVGCTDEEAAMLWSGGDE
jgi:hypothetical protein